MADILRYANRGQNLGRVRRLQNVAAEQVAEQAFRFSEAGNQLPRDQALYNEVVADPAASSVIRDSRARQLKRRGDDTLRRRWEQEWYQAADWMLHGKRKRYNLKDYANMKHMVGDDASMTKYLDRSGFQLGWRRNTALEDFQFPDERAILTNANVSGHLAAGFGDWLAQRLGYPRPIHLPRDARFALSSIYTLTEQQMQVALHELLHEWSVGAPP